MTDPRPLKVFLCHSSGDKPAVRELYQKLAAEGWVDPWLDEEKLYPGQDWDMEIEKAVEETDAVIVCLSGNSVTKEGYVQHELRMILNMADYKPEGTLFLFPIRLDDCSLPRRLKMWHCVDFFERRDWAYGRLLHSLKLRADGLGLQAVQPESEKTVEKQKIASSPIPQKQAEIPNREPARLIEQAQAEPKTEGAKSTNMQPDNRQDWSRIEFIRLLHILKLRADGFGFQTEKLELGKQGERQKAEPTPILPQKAEIPKREPARTIGKAEAEAKIEIPKPANVPPTNAQLNDRQTWGGIEFVRIPAGGFLMGSKKENELAYEVEYPQHTVDIPYDYWLARFPVTNEQYAAFIGEGKHPVNDWQQKKDHPVVLVSWQEALNYCQWLNKILKVQLPSGMTFQLPTEAEWEKAARGPEGLEWPWGNEFDKGKCNSSEDGKGDTTPVGLYSPQGDSPYGCADMAGNVWEWTHSMFKAYPYQAQDGREDESASDHRALRGGSFFFNSGDARCAYRYDDLDYLDNYRGFRVAVSPVSPVK